MKQLKSPKTSVISHFTPSNQSKLLIPILIIQFLILGLASAGNFLLKLTESPTISTQKRKNNRSSPLKAVEVYFLLINDGIRKENLESAWQLMSAKYRLEDSDGDYTKFNTWWQKLQRVEIQQIYQTDLDANTPQIEAKMLYYLKDGKKCADYVQYSLIWDTQNDLWLLNSRDRLLPNSKFIC